MVKEPTLPNYLPMTGGRIVELVLFPYFSRCDMQTAQFKVWTQLAVSVSFNHNHYSRSCLIYKLLNTVSFIIFFYHTFYVFSRLYFSRRRMLVGSESPWCSGWCVGLQASLNSSRVMHFWINSLGKYMGPSFTPVSFYKNGFGIK